MALSGRPSASVRRIWADGKLLRGAAGDFKTATGFRLHPGDEDASADPLIAAVEGAARRPAYRGIAYAVFEDMSLDDFGNRIPSLTFEVVADPAPVPIGAIAEALADGAVTAGETPTLRGYAATGDSVRDALRSAVGRGPAVAVGRRRQSSVSRPASGRDDRSCRPPR